MSITSPVTGSPHKLAHLGATALLLALSWTPGAARAAELRVQVATGSPQDLQGTVVSLHPAAAAPAVRDGTAVMDQRDSTFVPGVLPVRVGTRVSFPNSDRIRHQVYSFSPAKPFELPLYAGADAPPVHFDQLGVVVVGCNIHDRMVGYVVVLDTPYFGRAGGDGQVLIDAPPGRYRLQAWHPRIKGPALQQEVVLRQGGAQALQVELDLPASSRRPASSGLRALQDRLRRNQARP